MTILTKDEINYSLNFNNKQKTNYFIFAEYLILLCAKYSKGGGKKSWVRADSVLKKTFLACFYEKTPTTTLHRIYNKKGLSLY